MPMTHQTVELCFLASCLQALQSHGLSAVCKSVQMSSKSDTSRLLWMLAPKNISESCLSKFNCNAGKLALILSTGFDIASSLTTSFWLQSAATITQGSPDSLKLREFFSERVAAACSLKLLSDLLQSSLPKHEMFAISAVLCALFEVLVIISGNCDRKFLQCLKAGANSDDRNDTARRGGESVTSRLWKTSRSDTSCSQTPSTAKAFFTQRSKSEKRPCVDTNAS
mmetsp:Transcript_10508/g.17163  ORF Transcript_10508/g.17163 Transcript_10508/m.17163 type:complete len:225 (-) Transcript_10508:323-997(-)